MKVIIYQEDWLRLISSSSKIINGLLLPEIEKEKLLIHLSIFKDTIQNGGNYYGIHFASYEGEEGQLPYIVFENHAVEQQLNVIEEEETLIAQIGNCVIAAAPLISSIKSLGEIGFSSVNNLFGKLKDIGKTH